MPPTPYSLETVALRKDYPGTVALRDVSLRFDGGKIHALLGKNGAGKSTLVKLFAGAIQPTAGTILVNGRTVHFRSPREAFAEGIGTVHQELSLIPELSVAENILLGRLPRTPRGLVDWKRTYARASEVLNDLGLMIDLRAKARSLGMAQQQMVEIARAMSYAPAVLMLDEPTSALARHETEKLFVFLRGLAAKGVVLLYITHRLEEIHRIADTVTVLRNGELIGTIGIAEATPATIVQMMFGEVIRKGAPPELPAGRDPVLVVRDLSRGGAFEHVNFSLRAGEVLGIAGLLGSGRTELLRALFGADPHDSGDLLLRGRVVSPSSPSQMKRLGLALAPENRKEEGLIQILSARVNICLASFDRIARHRFLTTAMERATASRNIQHLAIALPSAEASVASLSGGNQQKVVLAKWLNTSPQIILLDEPTRGIDIQAKQQMFQIIRDLSDRGISSIVVSSELEELMDICHRILIMKTGKITGEIFPNRSTLERLFALCME